MTTAYWAMALAAEKTEIVCGAGASPPANAANDKLAGETSNEGVVLIGWTCI
jgi:hypothetical protein